MNISFHGSEAQRPWKSKKRNRYFHTILLIFFCHLDLPINLNLYVMRSLLVFVLTLFLCDKCTWNKSYTCMRTVDSEMESNEEWSLQLWMQIIYECIIDQLPTSVASLISWYHKVKGSNPVEILNFFQASHTIAYIAFTTAKISHFICLFLLCQI